MKSKIFKHWSIFFLLGTLTSVLTAISVEAAERIYFNYASLGFSVSVNSLVIFAEEGKINKELGFYLQGLTAEQQEQLRTVLTQTYDLNPVQVYRFFRTPTGEEMLGIIGNLINIQGGINGQYAIRGALVQAAADPDGLSLLNFIRKFPTNMELNTDRLFAVGALLEKVVDSTGLMEQELGKLSAKLAAMETPVDFSTLPDIRQPGRFGVEKQTITLTDETRKRVLNIDLYLPRNSRPGKTPVVVISHGLASRPLDFEAISRHLASYGYFVAVPQHPGSDWDQVMAMLEGRSHKLFEINEFIDRPLDITFLLNQLEGLNKREFQGKLDLETVGVMGHSFGGATALAVAGAIINFEQLEKDCDQIQDKPQPNPSLLFQCSALNLPQKLYNFRDERVKAIFITNPVTSSIFGEKGLTEIEIPVFMIAGTQDILTPALLEQIRSFPWLKTPDKYLALAKGDTHFNFAVLDPETTQILNSLASLAVPQPELIDSYTHSMSLAFFEVYITEKIEYSYYLKSSYAQYISKEPFPLYLVNNSGVSELNKALEEIKQSLW